MNYKILIVIYIFLLHVLSTSGCNKNNTFLKQYEQSRDHFQRSSLVEGMLLTHILTTIAQHPTKWGKEEPYGIEVYGFDEIKALLLVPLYTDFGIISRTLLLKTIDGGETWHLLTIMKGSPSIICFFDQNHLWIVTSWWLECPHVIAIYSSSNFGDSWQKNYSIREFFEFKGQSCFNTVEQLQFESPKRGVAKLVHEWGDFPTYFIETIDGGRTWQLIPSEVYSGKIQWIHKHQIFSSSEHNVWMSGESEDHIFIFKKADETWYLVTQFPKEIS